MAQIIEALQAAALVVVAGAASAGAISLIYTIGVVLDRKSKRK